MSHAQIRRDAHAERGLPDRGPGGEDHEIAGLEARGDRVELAKAGGGARDLDSHLHELGDPLEALLEERLDVGEVARDALLAELEHHLLRAVDEIRHLARPLLTQAA